MLIDVTGTLSSFTILGMNDSPCFTSNRRAPSSLFGDRPKLASNCWAARSLSDVLQCDHVAPHRFLQLGRRVQRD